MQGCLVDSQVLLDALLLGALETSLAWRAGQGGASAGLQVVPVVLGRRGARGSQALPPSPNSRSEALPHSCPTARPPRHLGRQSRPLPASCGPRPAHGGPCTPSWRAPHPRLLCPPPLCEPLVESSHRVLGSPAQGWPRGVPVTLRGLRAGGAAVPSLTFRMLRLCICFVKRHQVGACAGARGSLHPQDPLAAAHVLGQ